MKAVVDRLVQYPNRYKLTNAETGEVLGTFDFEEVTGKVQQVGTEIDKELFDSIANDLAARVVSAGGELAGTIVTFSDISGTAANVASGETSATLWGKVKNWFSRLKALAFKNKVAAGDFEAGAIKNADVAADAAISQSKVSGLESALASKANDADLAAIAKSGDLADATQDATHRVVTDTEKAAWNKKQNAITGGASTIVSSDLTEDRALVSDASGKVAVSDVTATELGYLDGVKSNIQEQLDNISSGTGFVSTSPQTLTDEQKLQARKNISAAAEEQALKNMYNLGAYDTYVDNGDGTVTVTRKTEYINPQEYFSNWYTASSWSMLSYADYKIFVINNFNKDNPSYRTGKSNYFNILSNIFGNTYIGSCSWIDYPDGTVRLNFNTGMEYASVDEWLSWLRSHEDFAFQFEAETSYTEKVILDQPIHTLDVNGEQFVRNEWEKGLNLFNIDEANLSVTHDCSATKDDNGNITIVKTGSDPYINDLFHFYATSTKYTVSARSSKSMQIFVNINGTYHSSQDGLTPVFTFNCNIGDSIYLRLDGNAESSGSTQTFSNIMLVEGDHAYPYQPYNGVIVHEKQLDDALEDYLPLTGGTINGTINATGQVQEAGQRVYSPNNPQTTIDHADNATNIIPDETGAVNPNGRKADAAVGTSSTALGRDSTASGGVSTALGHGATASGSSSTALGHGATASGNYSIAFVYNAVASGDYSIALGRGATASGNYSIAVGCAADASGSSSTALGYGATASGIFSTALGHDANVPDTDSYTMQLGSSSLSALRCQVNLTVTSDERDKTDIEGITDALAFIERLNPVTFVSNDRVDYISDEDKKGETFRTYGMCEYDRIAHAAGTKKGERRRCGLLAQEVIAAMQEVYDTDNYANIVNDNFHDLAEKPADVENKYTLAYANLVPFLIGAIKGLSAKIKELEVKLMSNKTPLEPFTLTKKPQSP